MRLVLFICLIGLAGCATQVETLMSNRGSETERINSRIRWAQELIQQGEYEQAKRPLTQALSINDNSKDANNLLGLVFQQQGENELAETYFRKTLAIAEDFSPAQNNFGIFLLLQNRTAEACKHLAIAASDHLYERRLQALENLAICYRTDGKPDAAEATFKQVVRLNPNAGAALLELGDMAFSRSEFGEAFQLFNRYSDLVNRKRYEHSAKSLWLGIRLSREGRDPGKAATYALLLKNLYPDSAEYKYYKESR